MLKTLLERVVTRYPILPRIVDLEVTKNCNLKCIGCPRETKASISKTSGPSNLTPEALRIILAVLPTVRIVNFIGDGEPLMNPHLLDLIELNTSKKVSTVFTTNGILITEDFARALSRERIRSVVVSIDSLKPDLYSHLRPGGNIGDVLLSLEYLKFYKIPTRINSLAVSANVGEKEILESLASSGNSMKGITFLHPIYAQGSDLEDSPYSRPPVTPTFRKCLYPFMRPYISLSGDIYSCCFVVGGNRTEWFYGTSVDLPNDHYKMGNILKDDFKEIWYGTKYDHLREVLKTTDRRTGTKMSSKDLIQKRRLWGGAGFNYCVGCLYRWGCSC